MPTAAVSPDFISTSAGVNDRVPTMCITGLEDSCPRLAIGHLYCLYTSSKPVIRKCFLAIYVVKGYSDRGRSMQSANLPYQYISSTLSRVFRISVHSDFYPGNSSQ